MRLKANRLAGCGNRAGTGCGGGEKMQGQGDGVEMGRGRSVRRGVEAGKRHGEGYGVGYRDQGADMGMKMGVK